MVVVTLIFLLTACNNSSQAIPACLSSQNWIRNTNNSIIAGSGTITNIGDPSALYTGGKFKIWASCVEADPNIAHVCYSESTDGVTWSTASIVFSPAGASAWDDEKTEIPTVILDNGVYKMWYGGSGSDISVGGAGTKTGYAESIDGISWTRLAVGQSPHGKAGLVYIPGFAVGDAGVTSDPVVLKKNSTYYMWYNAFGAVNDIHISLATSSDGINWTREPGNPVMSPDPATWEDGGPGVITSDVSHPTVLSNDAEGNFVMWYGSFDATAQETYTGIGFAASVDGIDWIKSVGNPVLLPDTTKTGEEIGVSTGPSVIIVDGTYHLFYAGANSSALRVINHAICSE